MQKSNAEELIRDSQVVGSQPEPSLLQSAPPRPEVVAIVNCYSEKARAWCMWYYRIVKSVPHPGAIYDAAAEVARTFNEYREAPSNVYLGSTLNPEVAQT